MSTETSLRAQRELLREMLQKVLVHVGMIEPWAGLGDLDATNDGPLLYVAAEDFITSCPDAKERLSTIERLVDEPPQSSGEIWCVLHRQPALRCVELQQARVVFRDECHWVQETDNQTHMKGEV